MNETVITSVVLLCIFVGITLLELWFLKYLGFDVVARLQLSAQRGETIKFAFEAFGAVAFIMVQPVLLAWLTGRISVELAETLRRTLEATSNVLF